MKTCVLFTAICCILATTNAHTTKWWSQVKTPGSVVYANRHYLELHRTHSPQQQHNNNILPDVFVHHTASVYDSGVIRTRRDVAGSLDIINNNAQPIHADVKPESPVKTEKVVPPSSATLYQKSLRKSLPGTSKLVLVRSINRLLALFVLAVAAAAEFYPTLAHLVVTIYNFMWE